MNIKVNINVDRAVNRIINDDVKLFANTTWWRLYQEFVPMRNGDLYGDAAITGKSDDVEITPEYIHHKVPYARRMYYGEDFNFSKDKHSKATAYWDKVAFNSQGDKLIKDIENYIKRK